MKGRRRKSCTPQVPCSVHCYHAATLCFCEKCRTQPLGYRVWDHSHGSWYSHLKDVPAEQQVYVSPEYVSCAFGGRFSAETDVHVMIENLDELKAGLSLWLKPNRLSAEQVQQEVKEGDGVSQRYLIASAFASIEHGLLCLRQFSASQEPTDAIEAIGEKAKAQSCAE